MEKFTERRSEQLSHLLVVGELESAEPDDRHLVARVELEVRVVNRFGHVCVLLK